MLTLCLEPVYGAKLSAVHQACRALVFSTRREAVNLLSCGLGEFTRSFWICRGRFSRLIRRLLFLDSPLAQKKEASAMLPPNLAVVCDVCFRG